MKQVLILVLLLGIGVGLFAETGLLGIWYGQDYNTSRKILESKGYTLNKNVKNVRNFENQNAEDCYLVVLYLDKKKKVAGWTLTFKKDLPEEMTHRFYAECILLHGTDYSVLAEDNVVDWQLDEDRSFKLGFDENNRLNVAIYIDDKHPELFISIE
ncbi:MAG: hypothetical protein RBS43_09670 [Candidatus Cloacimonas sp.]|jgi:hypothetical protein|nr:hypothetical protein [Candidatus Cloacimonas sp.]